MIKYESFIKNNFSLEESKDLIHFHQNKENQKKLDLAINLAIWSLVAFFFEFIFISASGYLTFTNGISLLGISPTLIFLLLNAIAKFTYLNIQAGHFLSRIVILKSIIPYFGSVVLLNSLYSKNKAYRKSIMQYLTHLKQNERRSLFSHTYKSKNGIKLILIMFLLIFSILYTIINYANG